MHTVTADAGLEPRYFQRMAASIGEKARILPWLAGDRILDVGAGGGELASAMADTGRHVWALDAADNSLTRLRHRPGVHVLRGFADEIGQRVARGFTFDTIVCSAVMHEVYSYGTSTGSAGYTAVRETVAALREVLTPGGRLIIRDGVMPVRPRDPAMVTVPDDELVSDYLALSPHPELRLHRTGVRTWTGTRHAVAEMLFTVTWGRESLHREALERYQLYTLDDYRTALAGFTARHADAVIQPGYRDALRDYGVFDGGDPWFPATNGLWVFDKV